MSGRSRPGPAKIEHARGALAKVAAVEDPFRRSLLTLAIVSEVARDLSAEPILVGGGALEWYTLGGYNTRDLDLVCDARDTFREVLEILGFSRRVGERHWYHRELDVAIEVPGERLAGSLERTALIRVNGYELRVIGVEDLILARLRGAVHWQAKDDLAWAARLLALHGERIDREYLERTAAEEGLDAALQEALRYPEEWDG